MEEERETVRKSKKVKSEIAKNWDGCGKRRKRIVKYCSNKKNSKMSEGNTKTIKISKTLFFLNG